MPDPAPPKKTSKEPVRWQDVLQLLPPPLLASLTLPGAPDVLAGAAAGAHVLSHATKQTGRPIAAAVTLVFFAAWLPLPVSCILAGMYVAEAMFADSLRLRIARLIAAALCLEIILLTLNIRLPPEQPEVQHAAPAFALALLAMISGRGRAALDPLLCALLSLLLLSFALSVKLAYAWLEDYPQAIAAATVVYCAALAAISLLMAPLTRSGGGLHSILPAFALEVPLDKWIGDISAIAEREKNAREFLAAAAAAANQLPNVEGVAWSAEDGEEKRLGANGRPMKVACPPLTITFFRRRFASPWTWFGHYLLCRVVSEYYLSKRREEEQRAQNLLQATHQAGARVTHDIKNILHALSALSSAKDDAAMRRQLPMLRGRLETALAKLRAAPDEDHNAQMPAATWWSEAKSRHSHTAAQFLQEEIAAQIPPALFDRALDNFLENATRKTSADSSSAAQVVAQLSAESGGATLRVTDNGDAVPEAVAKDLFARPVSSADGFGVALYQLAREAAALGYRAYLEENRRGKVVFCLTPCANSFAAAR